MNTIQARFNDTIATDFFWGEKEKIQVCRACERQDYSSSSKQGDCVSQNSDQEQFGLQLLYKYSSVSIYHFIKV